MENEVFTPLLEQFMTSPLVTWVKTFGPLAAGNGTNLDEYVALVDGVFLNQVMLQINPKSESQRVNKKVNNDASLRIHNLSILVRQIKFYYQCQKKEEFIERIQGLDFDTKAAVAAHIQETIVELSEERDGLHFLPHASSSAQSPCGSPGMKRTESRQHLSVELADAKAKIRRLRQELEEKTEQLLDCKQELEQMEIELKRLQQENMNLLSDARSARMYRDELDALREKAVRVDKLESEVSRYKERLHDIEFYKARVEELKEDNQVLLETKTMLEDQLEGTRARSDKLHELEKENLQLKAKLHDMEMIKILEQENEHLNQTVSSLRQRSQISAEARVKDIEKENKILHESIKETSSKLSKIEFEKRQIRKELEHYKEKGERAEELENELHHLEKENELLQKKITNLKITCEKIEALEQENSELERENRKFKKTLDSFKNLTFQLESLEKENSQLDEENLELRRSVESLKCASMKMAQLQLENKELESEKEQLKKGLELMKASFKKTERLEVSYQGLDTENQRLQKALENSNKKIQQLESELQDLEMENQTLQKNLEELKISSKRLEQLEKENKSLEQETSQLEKDKKQLEKENKRLRQQAEIKDTTLEENNVKIGNLEKENKTLFKEIGIYKESCIRLKELEKENKELVKRATIDIKTLVTLREDLVSEKLKTQQMNNDLEKLTHELEKIGLNKERLLHDEQSTDDRYKLLESKLESTLKKSLEIKEEKIAALEARLEESTNYNQQLRQELKTVKKNYEALKQRQDEERMVQSSPPAAGEDNRWERESQETTRELLKVKDRLIEVERNNATLQAEKQALKTQLRQLETQNSNLQAQILALQRQTVALQEQNSTLQTQNAKLQVENSTLNSQSTSLMNQNAQLLIQQSSLENENESVIKEREDLKSLYDSLVKDHEKLELLHERQASEYETLIAKHGTLKSAHKNLEVEHKDLEDRYNQLLKQKGQLEDLEKTLKVEQEKMLLKNKNHETVAAEFKKLCGENDRLNHTYNQLLKETEVLQTDHKNLKSLLNNSKLEQTRLEAEFSKLKEQYQQLDITSTKLNNQCELLSQLKGNLEEENRHLLDQIQTLMLQNRTLLEQNMESKDLFHVEQRQYIDKLNELRRQKEKLEEKIMDQYKFYDPSPPRRRGNWITLKMRKLIKSKKDVNRERQKSLTLTPTRSDSSEGFLQLPHQDSQDSSSVGSNSLEDGQTLGTKKSSTMNDLVQSMVLAGGQWTGSTENLEVPDDISTGKRRKELGAMAFSTTAINFSTVNSSTGFRSKQLVNNKAGAVNIQSRPQSHSSGEFSLLHEHEAWSSSGSSPIQYLKRQTRSSPVLQHRTLESRAHHKIKTGSPGSEVVTLQQFLEESNKLTSMQLKPSSQENLLDEVMKSLSVSSDFLGKNKPVSCGLARSVSGKTPGDFHDRRTTKPEQFVRPGPQKAEDTCFMSSSGKPTRGAQGKIKLIKETSLSRQSKDSNPYATLPRASNVISTAEGTTRRTSIHDFLAKDSRLPVSVDSPPASADSGVTATSSEYCLHQRSSHTPHSPTSALGSQAQNALATDRPQSPHTQARNSRTERSHFLNQTFAMINMSNDAFGRSATDSLESFTVAHLAQPFLSLNTELVSNISGLPPRPVTRVTDQASASLEKTAQKDNEQFSGHQSHSSINPQSSVDNNNLTTPACLYPDDTEAALLVSEDNQTVWYEYGCV
ncbi:hypothetical protein G4228_007681 [Cervus hanglu yarkandensis]|nr:hypothetical protein G4228_007681 [Cervus hanglu yarkandensis]